METTEIIYEVTGTQASWTRGGTMRFVDRKIKCVWVARRIANDSWTATVWTVDPVTGKRSRFETQKQARVAYAKWCENNRAEYRKNNPAA
jgi:hypothetical protein